MGCGIAGDSFGGVLVAHAALARDREREHRVSEIVKAAHWRPHRHAADLDHSQSVRTNLPSVGLEIGAGIESRDDHALRLPARRFRNLGLRRWRDSNGNTVVSGRFFAKNAGEIAEALEVLLGDRRDERNVGLRNVAKDCDFARKARAELDHRDIGFGRKREQRERNADPIVEIARSWRGPCKLGSALP